MDSQKKPTLKPADVIVKYGKTTYQLYFHFAEKGKQTMNDKILKLIRSNSACEPNTVT